MSPPTIAFDTSALNTLVKDRSDAGLYVRVRVPLGRP